MFLDYQCSLLFLENNDFLLPFGDLRLGAFAWSLDLVDSDGDDLASLVASEDSVLKDDLLQLSIDDVDVNLVDLDLLDDLLATDDLAFWGSDFAVLVFAL